MTCHARNTFFMIKRCFIVAMCCCVFFAQAKTHRSSTVKAEFQRQHPCPTNGGLKGACPGWIKDHIIALDCNGADNVSNMQWQTTADAKAKDKWERKGCNASRLGKGVTSQTDIK